MSDPLPKYAAVDTTNPEAWAQCDRCSFWRNRSDLIWQYEWGGMQLYNKSILVCFDRCYDTPQEQLRTVILPPDPPPIINARPPDFGYSEQMVIQFQFGTGNQFTGKTNSNQPATALPPWGAGPQTDMMTQDQTAFLIFQYTTTNSVLPG